MPAEPELKTAIVKTSEPDAALKAAETVLSGGVIVYPTETLYGIGGLASRPEVAERVSAIKQRPPDKPLPVLVKDLEMLAGYFVISRKQTEAYKKILPLPLTLVLRNRKTAQFPPQVSKDGQTAARISSGEFVRSLFALLNEPLISSSANISGSENLSGGERAAEIFGGKVELIVDSGNLPVSEGSAIVNLSGKSPEILREGDIEPEQLRGFLRWLS